MASGAGSASAQRVAGTGHWDKYAKGTPEDLSDEQREIVADFLKRVPTEDMEQMRFPCEPPEYFACRVLRARKFSANDSIELVKKTAAWRREHKVDELKNRHAVDVLGCLEDEMQAFYQKTYFPTVDKEGRPVYVEMGGVVDAEAMFLLTELDKLVDYHVFANETHMVPLFCQASAAAGKPITNLFAIIDMEGMSLKLATSAARSYITRMIGIDSAHYPETLGKMFIINVPAFFSGAWALITPFLDERTQRKIEIISSADQWKKRLRDYVDVDKLPSEYGGSLQLPGGLWPQSRTKKTHIGAGKVHTETVPVKAGEEVRFRWFCRPGDMRFAVTFLPAAHSSAAEVAAAVAAAAAGAGAVAGAGGGKGSHGHAAPTLPAGAAVVYPIQDHPGSDGKIVSFSYRPAADGVLAASYDNAKGWRARDVFHRWDRIVDGKPVDASPVIGLATGGAASAPTSASASASHAKAGGAATESAAAPAAAGGGGSASAGGDAAEALAEAAASGTSPG